MKRSAETRILLIALTALVMDQITKWAVVRSIGTGLDDAIPVIEGIFQLVHLGNTGAAWSMLQGNAGILAVFSVAALVLLWVFRKHFEADTPVGQAALGLILGGVAGNMIDRVLRQHVVDFLYFYIGFWFPAFNLADSAICCGVGLMFLQSFRNREAGTLDPDRIRKRVLEAGKTSLEENAGEDDARGRDQ